MTWLVLTYRPPATTTLNAAIRSKLTGIGAVYPVNAVAVLPASPASERALRRTRKTIAEAGGSAELLRAEVIEGTGGLTAALNAAREQECGEPIAACADITPQLGDIIATGRSGYRDLGEMDAALKRLSVRTGTIKAHDTFGADNAGAALSALFRCRAALGEFARRVYETDNTVPAREHR